jgi:hypothetical protein
MLYTFFLILYSFYFILGTLIYIYTNIQLLSTILYRFFNTLYNCSSNVCIFFKKCSSYIKFNFFKKKLNENEVEVIPLYVSSSRCSSNTKEYILSNTIDELMINSNDIYYNSYDNSYETDNITTYY